MNLATFNIEFWIPDEELPPSARERENLYKQVEKEIKALAIPKRVGRMLRGVAPDGSALEAVCITVRKQGEFT